MKEFLRPKIWYLKKYNRICQKWTIAKRFKLGSFIKIQVSSTVTLCMKSSSKRGMSIYWKAFTQRQLNRFTQEPWVLQLVSLGTTFILIIIIWWTITSTKTSPDSFWAITRFYCFKLTKSYLRQLNRYNKCILTTRVRKPFPCSKALKKLESQVKRSWAISYICLIMLNK